jgi:hypothetical protein
MEITYSVIPQLAFIEKLGEVVLVIDVGRSVVGLVEAEFSYLLLLQLELFDAPLSCCHTKYGPELVGVYLRLRDRR